MGFNYTVRTWFPHPGNKRHIIEGSTVTYGAESVEEMERKQIEHRYGYWWDAEDEGWPDFRRPEMGSWEIIRIQPWRKTECSFN